MLLLVHSSLCLLVGLLVDFALYFRNLFTDSEAQQIAVWQAELKASARESFPAAAAAAAAATHDWGV